MIVGQAIAGAFDKDAELKNPFEHRVERPLTDEEKAELEAAKDRLERIRERVAERQRQRAQNDGSRGQ